MNGNEIQRWFDFAGKVTVVTGGTGVLLRPTVLALGRRGACIVLLGRNMERARQVTVALEAAGAQAHIFQADVTDRQRLGVVAAEVLERFDRVDVLINGAGGNQPQATTSAELSFFDLPDGAVRQVLGANFLGTFFCCQAFGRAMAERGEGVILNVASMTSLRPLTRTPAYSAAKAALANFTQWLAVHMAQEYSPNIRVNAIAPGFFLTAQNRFLLTDEVSGGLTSRGRAIIEHTPMGRFGDPEDLVGTTLWLLSPASAFVTGIVVPVDGGFSAYSGV